MPGSATTPHPYGELLKRVEYNLHTRCNVQDGAHVLVGVSGGSDSMALLFALAQLSRRYRLRLTVAHFDHRLRTDSSEDAHFVMERAGALGFEVCVGRWAEPEPGEDAARRARHTFLARTATQRQCDVIALAHQLEDQIETVLMRLARGAGLRGLAGIAWRRAGDVDIVRPLLDCRRAELVDYLRAIGQPWREDPSNRDFAQMRNRIRHGLLPVVQRMLGERRLERTIDGLDELRAVWEFVSLEANRLLQRAGRRTPLSQRGRVEVCDTAPLRGAPQVVCTAALQEWFEGAGCQNLRRQHLRAATDLIRNGQSGHEIVLPGAVIIRLEQRTVLLEVPLGDATTGVASTRTSATGATAAQTVAPTASGTALATSATPPAAATTPPDASAMPPAARLERETSKSTTRTPEVGFRQHSWDESFAQLEVEIKGTQPDRATILRECTRVRAPEDLPMEFIAWVDADGATAQPWVVRRPHPGERVRLLGAPGARRLARIFQDNRVPQRLRGVWPLVADAEGILWVPGIGIAERARLHPGTHRAARLTLRRTPGVHQGDTTAAARDAGAFAPTVRPDAGARPPDVASTHDTAPERP